MPKLDADTGLFTAEVLLAAMAGIYFIYKWETTSLTDSLSDLGEEAGQGIEEAYDAAAEAITAQIMKNRLDSTPPSRHDSQQQEFDDYTEAAHWALAHPSHFNAVQLQTAQQWIDYITTYPEGGMTEEWATGVRQRQQFMDTKLFPTERSTAEYTGIFTAISYEITARPFEYTPAAVEKATRWVFYAEHPLSPHPENVTQPVEYRPAPDVPNNPDFTPPTPATPTTAGPPTTAPPTSAPPPRPAGNPGTTNPGLPPRTGLPGTGGAAPPRSGSSHPDWQNTSDIPERAPPPRHAVDTHWARTPDSRGYI